MPRLTQRNPKYRRHRASGQAVVTLNGRDCYLGPHGTRASRDEYDRLIGQWLANGRRSLTSDTPDYDVNEIVAAFWRHAQSYYRRLDGTPTSELKNFRDALRPLKRLYGKTLATEFGPLALRALQVEMVRLGWARTNINRQVNRVRHVFKWAAGREMVPAAVYHGLQAVEGLKAGRSDARESEPVRPVAEPHVCAVLPHVSAQVAAMIQLQLLTGMRPGEVLAMRGCDVDTSGKLWSYTPATHKTQHHGHARVVMLGPMAQEIIRPLLKPEVSTYLFSPADAESARREAASHARQTSLSCGNLPGYNVQRRPRKTPGQRYTVESYCKAIAAGCDTAFPPPPELARQRVPANGRKRNSTRWETTVEWKARLAERWSELQRWRDSHHFFPHQLRHTAATRLRREYGLEAAQVILGHRTLTVTQVYAERNILEAQRVMSEAG